MIRLLIQTTMFLCLITQVIFAQESNSRLMRVGESQYFSIDSSGGQDIKIKLLSVQNGVAVLEKEYLKKNIPEVQYYYAAPGTADAVAPILLQPYSSQVTSDSLLLKGISENNMELYIYSGNPENFKEAVLVENAEFTREGSNFSVQVPLALGDNNFFISYAPGVVGKRAIASIKRVEAVGGVLNADLDPIGSDNIRITAFKIETASVGTLDAIETILGESFSRTQTQWDKSKSRFEAENSATKALERSFHLSYLGSDNKVHSNQTLIIPTDDVFPVIEESNYSKRFTPSSVTISETFSDDIGVRFAWIRLLDNSGIEIARTYIETVKLSKGSLSVDFPNTGTMNLKVYAHDGGMLNSKTMDLPSKELLNGKQYFLEIGVTDIAGNRSNVKEYDVSAFTWSKEINISLAGASPKKEVQAYPLLLRLSEKDIDFSTVSPAALDLRFFDENGNNINFEVERFDAKNKKAEIWVNIPRIAAGAFFIKLNMLWGSAEAEYYGKPSSVWSDGFRGVYHFNEKYLGPYIPETDFSSYIVYAKRNVKFSDRAHLNGIVAASGTIKLGSGSEAEGTEENVSSFDMTIVPVPKPGSQDIIVAPNTATSPLPEKYKNLTLEAGSRVKLISGTYHFNNVNLSQEAVLEADISNGAVVIKIAGEMKIASRSRVVLTGNTKSSMLRFDVSSSNVHLGTDVKWKGILTAPNATVNIEERVEWTGALYAGDIVASTDVSVIPDLPETRYPTIPFDNDAFPPNTVSGFDLFAVENISLQNNSNVKGWLGSKGNISLGNNAQLQGEVLILQNFSIGDHSVFTGNVLLGGSLSKGANVDWSGSITPLSESKNYSIPGVNTNIGTASVTLNNDQVYPLNPGSYKDLTIRARGNLQLSAGVYNFENVQVESEGIISVDMSGGVVEVVVAGNANFGDRVKFINSGSDNFNNFKLSFATNGSVRFGNYVNFKGAVKAPNAEVILGDNNTYAGNLWARRIQIGNGSSFISERFNSNGDENIDGGTIFASDYIGDATRFKHNGLNTNSASKNGIIAESQFFKSSSNIELASSQYFRNKQGTLSGWFYFDGTAGRILSSSNTSVSNWEWKISDEGNLTARIGTRSVSIPVQKNTWVLLSLVQNNSEIYFYLNDVLQAKSPAGDLASTSKPWLGSSAGTFGIDEFRMSEVARNEDWIKLDYHTQKIEKEEKEPEIEFAILPTEENLL